MRTPFIALALGVLLVGVAHGQDKTADQKRADAAAQQNARGAALLREGKAEEAIVELQQAVDAAPSSVLFQSNLAYAYDRQGKVDEAVAAYRKVIELDPKNAVARNNLANLYSKKGQYEDAIREFEDLLQLDPANATARANLESATRNKGIAGQRQDQIGAALKAAEASPKDPRPAYDAARAYARLGDAENALAWLARAFELWYDKLDYLNADPDLASLRKDPRFTKLLDERRAGR